MLNTIYFKYAIEVERVGSISKAAANLYVAQPNLSKAIRDLEEELGYSIFERTSTGVKVTTKGDMFLYHAKKLMEQMSEIENIAHQNGGMDRQIKYSIPRGSYIANGFTAFIAEMNMKAGTEVTLNETNAIKTIDNVADRGYNMGIIRYPESEESIFLNRLKNNHLVAEIIWEFEYVLVMARTHPLASKEEITPDDLKAYTQITHGDIELPGEKTFKATMDSAEQDSKVIYVYERGSQFDLLANVPTTYMWVSPIPQEYLDKNHLVQRMCKSVHDKYKDVLIYREDYNLSEYDKLFQKKLYESKVEVSSLKCI